MKDLEVWITNINTIEIPSIDSFLDKNEDKILNCLKNEQSRHLFIKSRFFLKNILKKYLHIPIEKIQIHYSKYSKPSIYPPLQFNLSHSKSYITCVVSPFYKVGIDIEFMKDIDALEMGKLIFSQEEWKIFSNLRRGDQKSYFFHTWTCKEAFLKGIGIGLHYPLNKITIKDFAIKNGNHSIKKWQLVPFTLDSEYKSIIAVKNFGESFNLKKYNV